MWFGITPISCVVKLLQNMDYMSKITASMNRLLSWGLAVTCARLSNSCSSDFYSSHLLKLLGRLCVGLNITSSWDQARNTWLWQQYMTGETLRNHLPSVLPQTYAAFPCMHHISMAIAGMVWRRWMLVQKKTFKHIVIGFAFCQVQHQVYNIYITSLHTDIFRSPQADPKFWVLRFSPNQIKAPSWYMVLMA